MSDTVTAGAGQDSTQTAATGNETQTATTTSTDTSAAQGQTSTATTSEADKTGTTTTATENKDGKDGASSTEEKPEGAPETYADFTLPEGFSVDNDQLTGFHAWAKENNLTQEQAQKGFDLYAQIRGQERDAWNTQVAGWAEQTKNDKEIGGAAFEENKAAANKALKEFGSPEFTQLLVDTGYANHPEVVRTFVKIGKMMGEGSGKRPTSDGAGGKKPLSSFYTKTGQQ